MKKIIFILCLFVGLLFFQKNSSHPKFQNQVSFNFQSLNNDSILKKRYLQDYQKAISVKEKKSAVKDSFLFYINAAIENFKKVKVKNLSDADLLYYEKELYFQQQNNYKEALKVANEFRALFAKNLDWNPTNLIIVNVTAGNYNLNLGNFSTAITEDLLPNLKLIDSLEKAKEPSIHPEILQNGRLLSYNFLILNYSNNGELKNALSYIDSVKVFLKKHSISESTKPILEDVYTTVIDTYMQTKVYQEALFFVNQYDKLYSNPSNLAKLRIADKKRKIYFATFQNDSVVSTHEYITKLYKSLSEPNANESFYYGKSLEQTALIINEHFSNTDKAIAYLKEAAAIYNPGQYTTYVNPLFSYARLIELYAKKEQKDSILTYLNKLETLSKTLKNKSYIAESKGYKSEFYLMNKDFKELDKNNASFIKFMQWKDVNYFLNSDINKLKLMNGDVFLKQTLKIAKINFQVYQEKKQLQNLQLANKLYAVSALMLNEQKMATVLNETKNTNFEIINNGLLETLHALHQENNAYKLFAESLEMLELNQNLNLLFNHYLNQISFVSNKVSKSLITEKNQIERKYKIISEEINQTYTSHENKDEYQLKLDEQYRLKTTLDSIYQVIKKEDALFYAYNNANLKLKDFQQKLNKNQAVLRYFFSENSLFAFQILKNDISFQKVSSKHQIEPIIQDFYAATTKREIFPWDKLNQLLPNKEVFRGIENLIIVPHKTLSLVPFEALAIENQTLLVESFKISYVPSLNLFSNNKDNSTLKMAAFVPNYIAASNENLSQSKLSAAEKEARRITKLLEGDIFEGEKATKSNFLEMAKNYNLLHLAMHTNLAVSNEKQANLLFFDDGKNSFELTLQDLYGLQIAAKLSVLSACNTGIGNEVPSEGIQSLARAFHYAGSEAVVMSLWKVPDRETAIIMKAFYTHLKNGKPKDKALQLAKKQYLENIEDPMLKHPYYWAGFVLSGSTEPVISNHSSIIYLVVFLCFVAFVAFFVNRKKGLGD